MITDRENWISATSVTGYESTWMLTSYDDSDWISPSETTGTIVEDMNSYIGNGAENLCTEGNYHYFRRWVYTPDLRMWEAMRPLELDRFKLWWELIERAAPLIDYENVGPL